MDPTRGYPDAPRLRWQVAPVSRDEEHIELRHGSALKGGWNSWRPVARIGRPTGDVFQVEWLVDPLTEPDLIRAACRDIDFLMIFLREPDPWAYACHHCATTSNLYSDIHWRHFRDGSDPGGSMAMLLRPA